MTKLTDIKINRFQLNVLLNDEHKKVFNVILQQGVFCSTCGGNCSKGVEVREIFLNSLNDIMIRGNCNACNGKVTRIMEFGEDKEFFEKANKFRKSIKL